jgi:hypothetical protein
LVGFEPVVKSLHPIQILVQLRSLWQSLLLLVTEHLLDRLLYLDRFLLLPVLRLTVGLPFQRYKLPSLSLQLNHTQMMQSLQASHFESNNWLPGNRHYQALMNSILPRFRCFAVSRLQGTCRQWD